MSNATDRSVLTQVIVGASNFQQVLLRFCIAQFLVALLTDAAQKPPRHGSQKLEQLRRCGLKVDGSSVRDAP